jgi:hypothetical protein
MIARARFPVFTLSVPPTCSPTDRRVAHGWIVSVPTTRMLDGPEAMVTERGCPKGERLDSMYNGCGLEPPDPYQAVPNLDRSSWQWGVLTLAVSGAAGCVGPPAAGSRLTVEVFFGRA